VSFESGTEIPYMAINGAPSTMNKPIRKDYVAAGPLRLRRVVWHRRYQEGRHEHAEARFVVLVAGEFRERFGTRSRECGPGTAIFRTPREQHFGDYSSHGGLYVSVAIPSDAYAQMALGDVSPEIAYDVRSAALRLLGARLATEVACLDQWSALAIQGLVLEVAAEMGRRHHARTPSKPPWIDDLCALLREDHRSTWSLTELAAFTDVHPAHLGRIFRKHVGVGVGDFLRELRVEEGRLLLESTTRSVAEVAAATGLRPEPLQSFVPPRPRRHAGPIPSGRNADPCNGCRTVLASRLKATPSS